MSDIVQKMLDSHQPAHEGPRWSGDSVRRLPTCSCGWELTDPGELTFAEHLIHQTELAVQEDIAQQIEAHRDRVLQGSGSSSTGVMIRMALDVAMRIARRLE